MGLGLPSRVPTGTRSSSRPGPLRHHARELGAPRAGPASRLSGRDGLTRRRHGASGGKPHARSLPHAAAPRDGSSGRDSRAGSRPASPAGFGGGRTPPSLWGLLLPLGAERSEPRPVCGTPAAVHRIHPGWHGANKEPPRFRPPPRGSVDDAGSAPPAAAQPSAPRAPAAPPEPPQELDAAGSSFIEVHDLEGALFPARSQHKGHQDAAYVPYHLAGWGGGGKQAGTPPHTPASCLA